MNNASKGYNLSISVNNFNLSYNDIGEGDIPIIFLHGYPFDKTMWQNQFDFFQDLYRLIACDIRGFGNSIDESSPLSIELFSDDLIKFMDKMRIKKTIICGLSMGGFIALNAITRFSDRFEALVLCDTQCIADTIEVKKKRYETINEIQKEGVVKFNEKFVLSVFHKNSITNKKYLVEQLKQVVFSNSKQIITQGLVALAERSETCSTLGEINIPTLIICGREDEVTPLVQSEFMNKNIKGSILEIIDNAGHVSNMENPHDFNKKLQMFLSNLNGVEIKKMRDIQRSSR